MARRLRGPSPYRYRPGNTALHRLGAGLKLCGLCLLSFSGFLPHPLFLIAPALILIFAALAAKIRPWQLLEGGRSLFLLCLAVILLRSLRIPTGPFQELPRLPDFFNGEGFLAGCRFGGLLLLSYAGGALLFAVTTTAELRESLEKLETLICRRLLRLETNPLRLSLGISLMLGFLPRFFEAWEGANLAWEARSGGTKLRRLFVIIPLVTERLMETAAETAEALEARGF